MSEKIDVTIGIDIGGTNTKIGLVKEEGLCIATESIPTASHEPIENFLARVEAVIERLVDTYTGKVNIKAIGIGAPNGNYYSGKIEKAPNLKWAEIVPIVDLIHERLSLPTWLTNDANAAAIGEKLFGVAKDFENFVVITLGTGLGSGIFVDGNLVYGHDGFAGEIGHTTVFHDGRDHTTNRKGSLETYVSATGIKRTVFELLCNRVEDSKLRDISYNDMTAKDVFECAKENDPIALEAFDFTGRVLGLKLSDTIAHLSPEATILFGGLASAGDFIVEPTKKYLEEYNLGIYKGKTKVVVSNLKGDNTAILGSAALAWSNVKEQDVALAQ